MAVIEKRSGLWIGKVGRDVLDDWAEDPKIEVEKAGLVYQGTREWRGTEVVWYAIDRACWFKRAPPSSTHR